MNTTQRHDDEQLALIRAEPIIIKRFGFNRDGSRKQELVRFTPDQLTPEAVEAAMDSATQMEGEHVEKYVQMLIAHVDYRFLEAAVMPEGVGINGNPTSPSAHLLAGHVLFCALAISHPTFALECVRMRSMFVSAKWIGQGSPTLPPNTLGFQTSSRFN